MLSYNESLKILKEANALLEGHFILSSGLHSKQYVQCAKLLSHPKKWGFSKYQGIKKSLPFASVVNICCNRKSTCCDKKILAKQKKY